MVHVDARDDGALVCRGLARRFGDVRAVDGVDLVVDRGETLGIAGSNGAGKTTLFNLVAGSLRPDAGTITFEGRRIDGLTPDAICRRGLARTFQTSANAPDRTVMENVTLAASYAAGGWASVMRFGDEPVTTAVEALELVGLADAEDVRADELSVFDQRRLMLGCAVATRPRMLLLDEPVGGLLPEEIEAMVEIVDRIRARGVALVVIEHVMSFLARVSPRRILIMHQGRRLFEGSAAQVVDDAAVRAAWLGDGDALPAGGRTARAG